MCLFSAFKVGRQNIFSTPRLNSWNGKFPIGSLYECTSSQKFSVPMSQASCLTLQHLSSPWDEISYEKNDGHRYPLSSIVCKQRKEKKRKEKEERKEV